MADFDFGRSSADLEYRTFWNRVVYNIREAWLNARGHAHARLIGDNTSHAGSSGSLTPPAGAAGGAESPSFKYGFMT